MGVTLLFRRWVAFFKGVFSMELFLADAFGFLCTCAEIQEAFPIFPSFLSDSSGYMHLFAFMLNLNKVLGLVGFQIRLLGQFLGTFSFVYLVVNLYFCKPCEGDSLSHLVLNSCASIGVKIFTGAFLVSAGFVSQEGFLGFLIMANSGVEELVVHLEKSMDLSAMESGIKMLGKVLNNKPLNRWGGPKHPSNSLAKFWAFRNQMGKRKSFHYRGARWRYDGENSRSGPLGGYEKGAICEAMASGNGPGGS